MQHILKGALAVSAFTLTLGMAQAQDLAPLNSDSEPDRIVWSELEAARTRGYATEWEANEPGIACVAIAILRDGSPIAAASVTAPLERVSGRDGEIYQRMRTVLPPLLPLGLRLAEKTGSGEVESQVIALINERNQARKQKQWALSDQIRDRLKELGVTIEDSKEGTTWRWG